MFKDQRAGRAVKRSADDKLIVRDEPIHRLDDQPCHVLLYQVSDQRTNAGNAGRKPVTGGDVEVCAYGHLGNTVENDPLPGRTLLLEMNPFLAAQAKLDELAADCGDVAWCDQDCTHQVGRAADGLIHEGEHAGSGGVCERRQRRVSSERKALGRLAWRAVDFAHGETLPTDAIVLSYRCGTMGDMEWAVLETPIGPVSVGVEDAAVHRVRLASRVNGAAATGVLAEAVDQLRAYFEGSRTTFDLPVSIPAGGELEQAVWAELLRIPYGEMRTYGEVAAAVGEPEAARAVGTACNRNPIPLIVPCHRVVGAGGKLVGFGAGLPRKRWLLEHEARVSLERAWA